MDLPSAASTSPPTAHFLSSQLQSSSTASATAQANGPPAGNAVGFSAYAPLQPPTGPPNPSATTSAIGGGVSIPPPIAGSSSGAAAGLGPIPILPTDKCPHKDLTRCSLHQGDCCSCADNRPHEQFYERYVDGIGVVIDAPRWAHYCSYCKDHWDRLHSRIPPFRENQPRITAWDLFHLATPPNVPPSAPDLILSESARHSLTPSAQAAILAPEDGFPQSYASFRHMSPNFSNEYHPVVAEHIRTWGELENRISQEPSYSPGFHALLAQYHNARYKAKRMTELDRQSRGGVLSVQATDEYFQLLSSPGPFDIPGPSNTNGTAPNAGSSSNRDPNLGSIGSGFSRVANLGSFLQSASVGQTSNSQNLNAEQPATNNQPPASSVHRRSPTRTHRRRGSTPLEGLGFWPLRPRSPPRPRAAVTDQGQERERERERERETGNSTAGMSSTAAAATTATSDILASSSLISHSIPPESLHHSYSSPTRPLNRSAPSSLSRPQRSRTSSSMATDIETDRAAENRRRQVRERIESEWESQRPISASSSLNTGNRTSADSTVIDAIMSDVPSSQNSENSTGPAQPPEAMRLNENENPSLPSRINRSSGLFSPTNEPWSVQLLGESGRNQSNGSPPNPAPRRDEQSSNSDSPHGPIANSAPGSTPSMAGYIFAPLNRRSSLRNPQEPASTLLPQISSEVPATRPTLVSPTNRLSAPANFLPSLPHLPAPRFSPPRNLTRPRGGSISTHNTPGHSRQNSTGSDAFAPALVNTRRRERTNPLAQALGTREDVEREDYESPIRTMFAQSYEEHQRAEERRRMSREMEAEQRDFLSQSAANPEATMRRLQEHRNRQYELLHRVTLQRQIDHFHAQNRIQAANNSVISNLYSGTFPVVNHHHHNHNHNPRSPDEPSGPIFSIPPEDDPSSNSEGDYEDLIPVDTPYHLDNDNIYGLVDGFLTRVPNENAPPHRSVRRPSRVRHHSYMVPEDLGNSTAMNGAETERDRLRARLDRNRRLRETEILRNRQNEALRDIAGLVDGVRNSAMQFSRWNRERDGGSSGPGRNGSNNAQNRTLDHPERPDNMKEEDLKIMVDCKVCYGQIADIVLLPCAHLVLCQWCAETVAPAAPGRPEGTVSPRSNCPVCRTRVEKKIKVFRC